MALCLKYHPSNDLFLRLPLFSSPLTPSHRFVTCPTVFISVLFVLSFLSSPVGIERGVAADHTRAFELHQAAADAGLAIAHFNLGTHYFLGKGTAQDFTQAKQCFERAAEKGFAQAAVNLGNMYMNGHGVLRDYVRAKAAYALAADRLDDARALMEKAGELAAAEARSGPGRDRGNNGGASPPPAQ